MYQLLPTSFPARRLRRLSLSLSPPIGRQSATMGKQSKHMKHKCIFLNDLRADLAESKAAKCYNNAGFTASADKVLTAYKSKYDTSMKSPLK